MVTNMRLLVTALALSVISFALSWDPHAIPDNTYDYVSTVWSSSRTCVMSGNNDNGGNIIASSNGGLSWNTIFSGPNLFSDIATTTFLGVAYLVAVSTQGNIIVIKNVGDTFGIQIVSPVTGNLYGVGMFNNTAYAVGQKGSGSSIGSAVFKSIATKKSVFTDWREVILTPTQKITFTAVTTYNGINVIVAGFTGTILYSSNGGKFESGLICRLHTFF